MASNAAANVVNNVNPVRRQAAWRWLLVKLRLL
jgi:hypothetical protein